MQLEIALQVQNMAPGLLGAVYFQPEESPANKFHLVFNEAFMQAIGDKCVDSFPGDSWSPLLDCLLQGFK